MHELHWLTGGIPCAPPDRVVEDDDFLDGSVAAGLAVQVGAQEGFYLWVVGGADGGVIGEVLFGGGGVVHGEAGRVGRVVCFVAADVVDGLLVRGEGVGRRGRVDFGPGLDEGPRGGLGGGWVGVAERGRGHGGDGHDSDAGVDGAGGLFEELEVLATSMQGEPLEGLHAINKSIDS